MDLKDVNSELLKREEGSASELQSLLKELKTRELSEATISLINREIDRLNFLAPEAVTSKKIKPVKNAIFKQLEKQENLVPRNYYATLWLPLGMTAFGLPLGVVVYILTGNVAFIGIGLPIGMALGSFYGATLDKKAEKEGRVLNFTEK
ncbi:hypothetical protein ACXYMT_11130 [Salinimicrobium sp. CAU 1759]